jgi:hypothetical protein
MKEVEPTPVSARPLMDKVARDQAVRDATDEEAYLRRDHDPKSFDSTLVIARARFKTLRQTRIRETEGKDINPVFDAELKTLLKRCRRLAKTPVQLAEVETLERAGVAKKRSQRP